MILECDMDTHTKYLCYVVFGWGEWNEWNQKEIMGGRREDLEKKWVGGNFLGWDLGRKWYDWEWSIPSQIGGFEL